MSDLREKLSGPVTQRPPVAQAPDGTELQHRLPSVVRSTSNVAQPERSTPLQKTSGGVNYNFLSVNYGFPPACFRSHAKF
jgi:hypothetical protein